MSITRHPPPFALGPFALGRGDGFGQHHHDEHQLAWTASGVLTMSTAESTWVLPRSRALWIPAGVIHSVAVTMAAEMCSLYFRPRGSGVDLAEPTVVSVSPLLGELILHLTDQTLGADERRRGEALVFDLLEPVSVAPLHTPPLRDERARFVADALTAAPGDPRTLADWGRDAGASERTLSRLFVRDTGLSFREWRAQLRLIAAVPLLAEGAPVAAVSGAVGYSNPSAFIAAFRKVFGVTPRAYFGASTGSSETR